MSPHLIASIRRVPMAKRAETVNQLRRLYGTGDLDMLPNTVWRLCLYEWDVPINRVTGPKPSK